MADPFGTVGGKWRMLVRPLESGKNANRLRATGIDLADDLVKRFAIRSRNDVLYCTLRSWRAGARQRQIAAFRKEKRSDDMSLVGTAAEEISSFLLRLAPVPDPVITCVPCGHSRRPDCWSKRLAQAVAARGQGRFVQVWRDRLCAGGSHPKEFRNLPPLEWLNVPDRFTVVVDDISTSGWHLEETLGALRGSGVPSMAIAWIGGEVGLPRLRGDGPEPHLILAGIR